MQYAGDEHQPDYHMVVFIKRKKGINIKIVHDLLDHGQSSMYICRFEKNPGETDKMKSKQ
jgi:hypothetical protein